MADDSIIDWYSNSENEDQNLEEINNVHPHIDGGLDTMAESPEVVEVEGNIASFSRDKGKNLEGTFWAGKSEKNIEQREEEPTQHVSIKKISGKKLKTIGEKKEDRNSRKENKTENWKGEI